MEYQREVQAFLACKEPHIRAVGKGCVFEIRVVVTVVDGFH